MDAITITTTQSGVRLSHSPITFTLTVNASDSSLTQDIRQAAVVTIYHGADIVSNVEIPADNQPFTIDVSEAVRGWFISKKYDCSSLAKLQASITEETFTMKVGYKCKRQDKSTGKSWSHSEDIDSITFTAIEGGLTEYAIYEHGTAVDRSSFANVYCFSLKPFSVETVNNGEVPVGYNASSGRTYYAEETNNPQRHRILFINSLGILESVSALMLEEKDVKYDTKTNKLYKGASFGYTPTVSATKTPSTSWKMSSGYCTREWCEWWSGEFMFAKRMWLELNGGKLVPVTISAETVTAYDKSKGNLMSVNFTASKA